MDWEDPVATIRWCDRSLVVTSRHYCLVLSEEAYREELTRLGVPTHKHGSAFPTLQCNGCCSFGTAPDGTLYCIVAIRDREGKTGIQTAALLCHEAVHIFQRYCEDIDEDSPSSEFEAYSIQWIAQELMEQYAAQTQLEDTMAKAKMTEAKDKGADKKAGVKEGSKADTAKDKAAGFPYKKGKTKG